MSLLGGSIITNMQAVLVKGGDKSAVERLSLGLLVACQLFFYIHVLREYPEQHEAHSKTLAFLMFNNSTALFFPAPNCTNECQVCM